MLSYADIPLVEAPAEGDVDEGIQGNDAANDNTNKMLKKVEGELVKNIKK